MSQFKTCAKCGKKLIEKKSDGAWYFRFGKSADREGVPVELYIHGSVRIKCIRRNCEHWNEFDNFKG